MTLKETGTCLSLYKMSHLPEYGFQLWLQSQGPGQSTCHQIIQISVSPHHPGFQLALCKAPLMALTGYGDGQFASLTPVAPTGDTESPQYGMWMMAH